MTDSATFTLAAIQAAPVLFDRDASTEKACALIEQAANRGATLAAFGETWLPGYCAFTNYPQDPRRLPVAARYLASAVEVPSSATDKLCRAARAAGIDVAIGIVERDARTQGTVYCTLLFIGREGAILGKHRKLKPTGTERIIWGEGDASTLTVYQRPYGRISGLNCWEHSMVLPGYVLMEQGTQIHVAAWPSSGASRHELLSRAFASQGACYVIAAVDVERPEDWPEEYRDFARTEPGNSLIIDPMGAIIAGPVEGETILTATGSLDAIFQAKSRIDVAGHYSRPDLFQLHVNRRPHQRVVSDGASGAAQVGHAEPAAFAAANGSAHPGRTPVGPQL